MTYLLQPFSRLRERWPNGPDEGRFCFTRFQSPLTPTPLPFTGEGHCKAALQTQVVLLNVLSLLRQVTH